MFSYNNMKLLLQCLSNILYLVKVATIRILIRNRELSFLGMNVDFFYLQVISDAGARRD